MTEVFVLHHVTRKDSDDEDVKLLGGYSTENAAHLVINRLKDQPGFQDFPAGLHIDRYELNKDEWVEGFVSA